MNDIAKEYCPKCGADFQGEKIPEKDQHNFGVTHFSRKIGIYDMYKDCTVEWQCPDCGHRWERGYSKVGRNDEKE